MKIHIGKEIEKIFQQSGMKTSVFAERINTGERNVYTIFKRQDIGLALLLKISEVLNYNFVELYNPNHSSDKGLEVDFKKTTSQSTITLNFGVGTSDFGQLPDFMKEISNLASKHNINLL